MCRPTTSATPPRFAVIGHDEVMRVLRGREAEVINVVRRTYLEHEDGLTTNPPSSFLRFEDRPENRIIALPASLAGRDGQPGVDGIKWISSVPRNLDRGLPRASAVAILNDPETGYPFACLEAATISAVRTAASAALAATVLTAGRPRPRTVGIVGAGVIARAILAHLLGSGWTFERVGVHDLMNARAARLASDAGCLDAVTESTVHADAEDAVRSHDLVVLTTAAASPYLTDPALVGHGPVVLNVSLRDLGPKVVLSSFNVVDDIEHCLRAGTSPHLAEQQVGHRGFVAGTIGQVLSGSLTVPERGTVVFSPFGLGVLDLAVARHVHDTLQAQGALRQVDGFFGPDTAEFRS
ncbi:MAG: 2,3-diaminopropionate biosynthesis protein SbnB [Intrasporangium sp.]|uniref:2,3-diaminopropionate biosynthesis protein SbnB n=1 Tax=Intrasporangium sp. TaxID=1925024 RepID=UPI0026477304|nr:2,3-diaminopropionate biosynthesis protein SbnB [Intrasporangium sp.]MDN5794427.1 2,3-diaminopropionate biosynthesis protein SbnB [Intrasporangium sp.]